MKKSFLPLALLLVLVLVGTAIFTACGEKTTSTTSTTPPKPTSSTPATTPSPSIKPAVTTGTGTVPVTTTKPASSVKKGGTLRYLYPYSPQSVPGWPGDTANFQKLWMCYICFEALVKQGSDGQPIPYLATKWEWGPNNTYITFTLRQGVKFHDGTPFNAEAVKLDFDQLMVENNSTTINWDRWEIKDDYTITLYLKKYQTDFWGSISNWAAFIVSPTVLKKGVEYTKEHPVGTGPFIYKSFELDVSLKFTKNPNYWQEGKPYLDAIDMYTVKENLTQQAAMEAGEGDMLALQQGKYLKDLADKGFNVIAQFGGTEILLFDTMNEGAPTNDPNVRKALEYATKKQEIVDALGYGYFVVTNQVSPPSNPSYNKDIVGRDYDPAKAKELLKAAGYENGLKIKLIVTSDTSDLGQYLQQYWKAVGIETELEMIDNAKFWNYAYTGWTGILCIGYSISTNFPSFIRGYFPPIGVIDVSTKIPQAILDKAELAIVETDTAKFEAYTKEITQMVFDDCSILPFYSNAMGDILSNKVKDSGILEYVDFSGWDPENCWLDPTATP
jgi:peptide/nickel transport system substrate-binding protein